MNRIGDGVSGQVRGQVLDQVWSQVWDQDIMRVSGIILIQKFTKKVIEEVIND
jgi:hypothetical protein